MKTKRRLIAYLLLAAMLLPLIACSSGNATPAASTPSSNTSATNAPAVPVKDTITFANKAEPSNLATTGNNEIASYYLAMMIYSGLFKRGAEGVEKDLCSDYYTEKDANGQETIWVFKLREGVKFSDGSDLTADDVVDTLMFAHEETAVKALTGFYTKVEKVDDYTVKLYTDGVFATVPKALADKACYILPSELIANGHDFGSNPIGSGPYKFVKWNKGDSIQLVANEYYYDGVPNIKNVNWRFIAEGTSRTVALESGEVDYVMDVASMDIPRLESDGRFTVSINNGSMFSYFLMNCTKEPFNDLNFRKFMAAAINREDALAVAMDGYGTPIVTCININIDGSSDKNGQGYDPEAAKKYLEAWGGDPTKIKFKMICSSDERRRFTEVIQSNLLEYGIQTDIEMAESATCSSLARSGDYDAFVFAYTTDDFATYAKNLYYVSDEAHAGNKFRMNYDDSLNAMIDEINSITNDAARAAKITEFTELLNAKQPVVPLYCSQVLTAYDKNLKGVSIDHMGYFRVEKFSW